MQPRSPWRATTETESSQKASVARVSLSHSRHRVTVTSFPSNSSCTAHRLGLGGAGSTTSTGIGRPGSSNWTKASRTSWMRPVFGSKVNGTAANSMIASVA